MGMVEEAGDHQNDTIEIDGTGMMMTAAIALSEGEVGHHHDAIRMRSSINHPAKDEDMVESIEDHHPTATCLNKRAPWLTAMVRDNVHIING